MHLLCLFRWVLFEAVVLVVLLLLALLVVLICLLSMHLARYRLEFQVLWSLLTAGVGIGAAAAAVVVGSRSSSRQQQLPQQ